MPWKECRKMDEKLKFVSRFLDGEKRGCEVTRASSQVHASSNGTPARPAKSSCAAVRRQVPGPRIQTGRAGSIKARFSWSSLTVVKQLQLGAPGIKVSSPPAEPSSASSRR